MTSMEPDFEPNLVAERYARRHCDDLYSVLRPEVWLAMQERQRAMLRLLADRTDRRLEALRVLEIGCGSGSNLQELMRLGFDPANLVGNELLPERVAAARRSLPAVTEVYPGDAMQLPFADDSFDIVYQSTVFTSLLDDDFQKRLAERMWRWVRPGGAVLWYDFVFDNPNNKDVRGVPLSRVRALFPQGRIDARRITLAPPIGRRVVRLHTVLYLLLRMLPLLRSHVLCWVEKPLNRRPREE
jgi:SAM-dependent methyltransferase